MNPFWAETTGPRRIGSKPRGSMAWTPLPTRSASALAASNSAVIAAKGSTLTLPLRGANFLGSTVFAALITVGNTFWPKTSADSATIVTALTSSPMIGNRPARAHRGPSVCRRAELALSAAALA